jgi:TonB-linked SusC/RagA family outer membrane protein
MKKTLVLFVFLIAIGIQTVLSQTRNVTGIVTSVEDGKAIPGASVVVKGTTLGTITDSDGKFQLKVPQNAKSIVVSFVGLATAEYALSGSANYQIELKPESVSVDEVVVTGYGTQKKREFTGAAAAIKGDLVENKPLQSFGQGLIGQAAGVSIITPNGLLNNPPVIRVRGLSSLSLSSFPLVVIDGIPVATDDVSANSSTNNPLADINPSDIESIDVLKDAASSAIYGSRAAAGVLVITTKRGKESKTKVTYDGWFGISDAVRLPDVLNAQEYIDYKNGAIANARLLNTSVAPANAFVASYNGDGSLVDTRWYDYIYRTAYSQNHNVTVSGGSAKTSYYFSAGYTDQDGFLKANNFNRKTARFNVDHQATSWLKLSANINYTNGLNNSPNSGSAPGAAFNTTGLGRIAINQIPNVAPYNTDGSYNVLNSAIGKGNNLVTAQFANPVVLIDLDKNSSETARLIANLGLELKLTSDLTFKTSYSWDKRNTENLQFWNPINGDGVSYNGYAYNNSARAENWNWVNTLQFKKTFSDVHNLSIIVGSDAQKRRTTKWGSIRQNLVDGFFDVFQGVFLTNIADSKDGNNISDIAYEAYLGNISYNYAGKYFISGNFRRDGNSALSSENRWGNFGGASVGWTVSEEEFFKDKLADKISTLRLKASWGKVGNGNLTNYYGAYNTYDAVIYGNSSAIYYSQAGNSELKWETSSQSNIGIDLGILKNRITFEANYYSKDVDNLILNVPQSPSKGIPGNSILLNVGSMYNRGWEFTINAVPVKTKDFSWNANLNFSTNKNRVTALVNDDTPILGYTSSLELASITKVGSPASSIYAVKTAGVNPENGRRIFINAAGDKVQYQHFGGTSAWTYLDGTKASAVSGADAQVLGGTLPTWFGGFNNTLRYKNFDLGLNFTFSGGNYIYNGTKAGLRDQRIWNNSTDVLHAWTTAGQVTDVPRAVYGDNVSNGSSFPIDANVEKGDFLRLQTVTLGYSLPSFIFGNSGINSTRLYAQVNNAFIITKYTGVDPEISTNGNSNLAGGIERNSIPQSRTITFGINVVF